MSVLQLYPKHCVWQSLEDGSFYFNYFLCIAHYCNIFVPFGQLLIIHILVLFGKTFLEIFITSYDHLCFKLVFYFYGYADDYKKACTTHY